MEIPEGLQYFEEVDPAIDCLRLKHTIYGTVQAARQWFKFFIRQLHKKLDLNVRELTLAYSSSKQMKVLLFSVFMLMTHACLAQDAVSPKQRKISQDCSRSKTLEHCRNMLALLLNIPARVKYYSVSPTLLLDSKGTLETKYPSSRITKLHCRRATTSYDLKKAVLLFLNWICSSINLEPDHYFILSSIQDQISLTQSKTLQGHGQGNLRPHERASALYQVHAGYERRKALLQGQLY